MSYTRLTILILLILTSYTCEAQMDSALESLQEVPVKYINQVDKKVDQYSNRITNKTEKTLTKLSRWENKIKTLLQKANPQAVEKLFGEGKTTFTSLLQKLQEGKTITAGYKARYDEYRDKLTTSLKYLEDQKQDLDEKLLQPVAKANKKLAELDDEVKQQEAVEAFIKERKKELFDEALKYIGKSKYLSKIDKESYYYVETIKNYKAIFNDKKKAEETALTILNRIPAFKKFIQENSMLAGLFGAPGGGGQTPNLAGLQTRASVTALIQNQVAAGGAGAQAQIMQNIQAAQAQLNTLKDKILKAGGSSGDMELPDFKINPEKSKTFFQRISLSTDLSFTKSNALLPSAANLGLSAAYKFSDKKEMAVGLAYKAGLGSINHIQITHQGLSLRSSASIKFKKNFWFTGGWEANQNAGFKNIEQLKNYSLWQQSGLIGLTKKMNIKTKWAKGTNIQLLYDMLCRQHIPVSQPVLFRVGYSFK